jgi:pSer/pThr/pTyr-binding forkhead associated (FHA) protein
MRLKMENPFLEAARPPMPYAVDRAPARLIVLSEENRGLILRLGESQTLIGRGHGVTLRIDDALASREHCMIEKREAAYLIHDHASRNGTWLNGRRIGSEQLMNRDIIQIGGLELIFDDSSVRSSRNNIRMSEGEAYQPVQVDDQNAAADTITIWPTYDELEVDESRVALEYRSIIVGLGLAIVCLVAALALFGIMHSHTP